MINREIIYERNITGSYMKIPVNMNAEFDEKILLLKKIPGLLPIEKTFINGEALYWYNISGRQSFDMFCKIKEISLEMIERLIISLCSQLEILEWNLIDPSVLMLDMELIYVSSDNKEFIFTAYPGANTDTCREFRQLMETLITKIDHKNMQAVHAAYEIYEKTLDQSLSLMQIRDSIISSKEETVKEVLPPYQGKQMEKKPEEEKLPLPLPKEEKKKESLIDKYEDMVRKKWKGLLESLCPKKRKKEDKKETPLIQTVVYSKDQEPVLCDYPTVLLSGMIDQPKGILIYEGTDGFSNITLNKETTHIGKGRSVDIEIQRDTISHFHAKIEQKGNTYDLGDMNSRNGTFVNHELIAYKEKRELKKNDIVSFADVQYRFS